MSLVKHSERTNRKPCQKCGAKPLYWAHDTDRPTDSDHCGTCDVRGKFTLMEPDGSRHVCGNGEVTRTVDGPVSEDAWAKVAEANTGDPSGVDPFKPEVPVVTPSVPVADDKIAAVVAALSALTAAPAIDRAAVEAIAREVVAGVVYPTRTVVVKDDVRREVEGNTHKALADVTTAILAGEHVMMVGPAGTGKSTIAEQAAEALGLASYSISLSPQTPASQIVGYMQATGDYVGTLFRKAFENGGLFHFDEIDNAHPSVLAVINGALANGHMAFPDGMVKRHEDFRVAASANTYGRGATRAYVGRQAIDAATLDRFTVLTVEIDETLEYALAIGTGLEATQVDKVITYVRKLRKSADTHGLQVVLSPRATVGMCRLLVAGMSWAACVDARIRRGLDDATWRKLEG